MLTRGARMVLADTRSLRLTSDHAVFALLCLMLSALVSAVSFVTASCPTNGNAHAIYVTSNMGDNVWSFDTQGTYIGDVLNRNSFPSDVNVSKLRAMRFGPGGYLYISSARGSNSQIFAVSGNGVVNGSMHTGCMRNYSFTVVRQDATNILLDHPYDLVFHPDTNDLFVANQNSVTVTKYRYLAGSGKDNDFPIWQPIKNIPGTLKRVDGSNGPIQDATPVSKKKQRGRAKAEQDAGTALAQVERDDHAGKSAGDRVPATQANETAERARGRSTSRDHHDNGTAGLPQPSLAMSATSSLMSEAALPKEQPDMTDDSAMSEVTQTVSPRSLSTHAGLFASSWSDRYALTSVRGMALSPKLPRSLVMGDAAAAAAEAEASSADAQVGKQERYLLVCDVAANAVHVFHSESGEWLFDLSVPSPIQVVFPVRYTTATGAAAAAAVSTASGSTGEVTAEANRNRAGEWETPYVYVTSKEDAAVYLVRFAHPGHVGMGVMSPTITAAHARQRGGNYVMNLPNSPSAGANVMRGGSIEGGGDEANAGRRGLLRENVASGDVHHTPTRLYRLTSPIDMDSASGLYENAVHGVLLVADRVGRSIGSYASPFLSNQYNKVVSPSPFLGYFLKQLPDQPEFITSVLLESQANIPFCYELGSSGSLRYSALCTAAYLWMTVFLLIAVVLVVYLVHRVLSRWFDAGGIRHRNDAELKGVYQPLLANDSSNISGSNMGGNNSNTRKGYGTTFKGGQNGPRR